MGENSCMLFSGEGYVFMISKKQSGDTYARILGTAITK